MVGTRVGGDCVLLAAFGLAFDDTVNSIVEHVFGNLGLV